MISEKSVQEIMETAKVEEVVQEFVSLKRRGANLIGLCPFHTEKTPSFTVSPSKNIFKCFGCGEGGNAVHFLMEHQQLTFPEALRYLAKKYHIEIEETGNTDEARAERQYLESLYLVNQFARDFFQRELFESDRGKSVALHYFKNRGFREDIIRKFGLGYAPPKRDALTLEAVQKGYEVELLRKLGLTKQDRDFFRDRVMFTIHNLTGKVIGFGGRILRKDAKAPKYINSPETEIYQKSKVLYGAYFAKREIRKQDECVLVEGYTDVLSLHQAGIENVVASSGTSLTEEQIQLIKRYTSNIKILYDGDPAGIKAALRGLDMVLAQGMNVLVVMLPEGEDPDSYLQRVGTAAFKEYLTEQAKDFILFKAELLLRDAENDPVRKTHAIKEIVQSIARIPDPLKRSLFIKECARVVEVEEQLLVHETNRVVSQRLKKQVRHQTSPGPESREGEKAAPPAGKKPRAAKGDEFQEKDILRILMSYGDRLFDPDDQLTVAEFILHNVEDVLDHFDSPLYKRIIRLCMDRHRSGAKITPQFFINHSEEDIAALAVDFMSSPYEYSENWEKRWEVVLQTQKMPDENFRNDAMDGVKKFKLRKIRKVIAQNANRLKELGTDDHEEMLMAIKVHQHLKEMEATLAQELGIVVL